jgi:hypothetical protein
MIPNRDSKKLGQILINLDVLTPREVERVLDALGRRYEPHKFGQMARDMGLASDEEVLAALAVQMNLFPGIQDMTLTEVLRQLQTPVDSPAG